jgi:uncharacterized membrane protein
MPSLMRTFLREDGEEGAIAILTAALLLAMMVATSLAVDVGKVAWASRDQQGITDRVVLDGARALEPGDATTPLAAVRAAATESLQRHRELSDAEGALRIVRVTLGRWEAGRFRAGTGDDAVWQADSVFPHPDRFPGGVTSKCDVATEDLISALDFDAVCIDTESFVPFTIAIGSDTGGRWVMRSAIAQLDPIATISAASTTASLSGGLLNQVLSELLNGSVDLDLVGYTGVADTQVQLGRLATALDLTGGSVDELLTTQLTVAQLIEATIDALPADGGPAAVLRAELQKLVSVAAAAGLPPIVLGGQGDEPPILEVVPGAGAGARAGVDALSLVVAAIQLANRERAIDLELDVLDQLIPVSLTVIQPPVIAVGPAGQDEDGWRTVARTAQLELAITLPFGTTMQQLEGAAAQQHVADYRTRRANLASCPTLDALGLSAAAVARRALRDDVKADIEALRDHANSHGLLTGTLSLLFNDILGGLASWLLDSCPSNSRLDGLIDDLEEAMAAVAAAGRGIFVPTRPTLNVTTGRGQVALAELGCAGEKAVGLLGSSSAAGVHLPEARLLDLGSLGRVSVKIEGSEAGQPAELGAISEDSRTVLPDFPRAVSPSFGTTDVGLSSAVGSISFGDSTVAGLRVGSVLDGAVDMLQPLLSGVDATLDPVLGLLGVELGRMEASVLDTQCTGRRLVR